MALLAAVNSRLSRWAMYFACICLTGLLAVVIYGVIMRYVFNDAPPYVEQVALLLVISVAMFGAAAGVRDAGHIGLDSLARILPVQIQGPLRIVVHCLAILFAAALLFGGYRMGHSTLDNTIPTLGISEAFRYFPVFTAGVLIALFSVEHILAEFAQEKVVSSWH
jgi:TRAP-type C4-dicarboxylate transport system permease small subunit